MQGLTRDEGVSRATPPSARLSTLTILITNFSSRYALTSEKEASAWVTLVHLGGHDKRCTGDEDVSLVEPMGTSE